VIKAGKTLKVGQGLGPLTITARTILLEPGAQIIADGLNLALIGGFVGLVATDTITLQNQALISVVGPNGGYSPCRPATTSSWAVHSRRRRPRRRVSAATST
jgi:hypothetical protein